jgi:hypothetical protein
MRSLRELSTALDYQRDSFLAKKGVNMNFDSKLYFKAESATVYRLIENDGLPYSLATPRRRKLPGIPVITICANQYPGNGKPDYFIRNGNGQNLTGVYFDLARQYGYGNKDKRDTLLFEWDSETGKLIITVVLNASHNATNDRAVFHEWKAACTNKAG